MPKFFMLISRVKVLIVSSKYIGLWESLAARRKKNQKCRTTETVLAPWIPQAQRLMSQRPFVLEMHPPWFLAAHVYPPVRANVRSKGHVELLRALHAPVAGATPAAVAAEAGATARVLAGAVVAVIAAAAA
jgi:type II secretory pathway component PulM